MRVYILTDLEGISGLSMWSQCNPALDPAAYEVSRRLLMNDVNAAVDGCYDGGATEVVVLDGHGCPFNMVPELMHPQAEYLCGRGFPTGWAMDRDFAIGMQVGAHAMNRTKDGVLCHTQNHVSDARYWYNGCETGELGQGAIEMAHFGFPCTFVSGDVAACREATAFFGEHCVTVPVKRGLGRQCAQLKSPAKARELIRAGACEAMQRGRLVPLYTTDFPARAKVETLVEPLPDGTSWEEIEQAEHRTHEGTCETALNIYGF
jgi:D-amino peptidase